MADSPNPLPPGPFLRWVGGKRKLVPTLLERLHVAPGAQYFEPFLGAGSLFFGLHARGDLRAAQHVRLSDANEELICAWACIRYEIEPLLSILHTFARGFDMFGAPLYYDVRGRDPAALSRVERAARMIFLNRLCFNGVYRVNKAGKFNVPLGKFAMPHTIDSIVNAPQLIAAHHALAATNLTLASEPFEQAVSRARAGDTIYFDPPYAPASPTANFTAYAKAGFGDIDQAALHDVAAELVARGARVLISNSDVPLTRTLYEERPGASGLWHVERVQVGRSINSDTTARGKVSELLISGRVRK